MDPISVSSKNPTWVCEMENAADCELQCRSSFVEELEGEGLGNRNKARRNTKPRRPHRAQAPSLEISRSWDESFSQPCASEAEVSRSMLAKAGDQSEEKHWHYQHLLEVPGEEAACEMLNLWAEEHNKTGKNQSAIISPLFPTKKSNKFWNFLFRYSPYKTCEI